MLLTALTMMVVGDEDAPSMADLGVRQQKLMSASTQHQVTHATRPDVPGVQTGNPAHVQKIIPIRYPTEYCRYGYNSY